MTEIGAQPEPETESGGREYLKWQFDALRSEIENCMDRRFKIMTGGIAFVPAAQFTSDKLELGYGNFLLPLVSLAIALLFVAENNAIMRCGRYIRLEIESRFPTAPGWEGWLETQHDFDSRMVDKLTVIGFYILIATYYTVSVIVAVATAADEYEPLLAWALGAFYVALAAALLALFTVRPSTSTSIDRSETPAHGLPLRRPRHKPRP